MRILYDIAFLVYGIFYVPVLLFKGRFHKEFKQRFGFLPENMKNVKRPLWIHAVSVGEAQVALKLASAARSAFPGIPVVISTTTKTGNSVIRARGEGIADALFYFPLDLSAIVAKVIDAVDPRAYVMVETELWPNLLSELHARKVPVILANGRISDRSFKSYRRIYFLMRKILGNIDSFLMQSSADAERIVELGASPQKVHVPGNMKFDEAGQTPVSGRYTKEDLGFAKSDDVIVAGSTHFSEENDIIDIYKELKKKHPALKLVLAPRHVERADAVETYIIKSGIEYARFTQYLELGNIPPGKDIVLVDTIGHLKDIYGIASLIFVGGSLVKRGGQNPIEGARFGKAIVFGPHMFNFREVSEIFLKNGAAVKADNKKHLEAILDELIRDKEKREKLSLNARRVVEENRGAVGRTVEAMRPYLEICDR